MSAEANSAVVRADFEAAIRRHFAVLFRDHGFHVIAVLNERAGEYQMVIAKNPQCKAKWKLQQDAFSLLFGRLDAPDGWADGTEDGQPVWFAVQVVMLYEDSLHPAQAKSLPPGRDPDDLEDVLDAYATLLLPYLERILQAFGLTPPPGWWPGFDAFIAAQLA